MNRLPGAPEEKLALLRELNADIFPHLVGDILFYVMGHRDVKIVDGPGDGRRDIHSITSEGEPHITQCKFHNNPIMSVSSRETDELTIGLLKFKVRNGMFATTGRLSPQAKREYIDNFAGYHLRYMEGIDIVDAVLSNPVMSSVWFHNKSISAVRHTLAIPFIARNPQTDRPIENFKNFEPPNDDSYHITVIRNIVSTDLFSPYRRPTIVTTAEDGLSIHCYHAVYQGTIYLHSVSTIIRNLVAALQHFINKQCRIVTMRIGRPFLTIMIQERYGEPQLKDRVPLESIEPTSYLLRDDGLCSVEHDFVLPQKSANWIFPKRLSVAESPWACWYNKQLDCGFMLQIAWKIETQQSFFEQGIQKLRDQWLSDSLFTTGSSSDVDRFKKNITPNLLPSWHCEYGIDGHMLAWLHPYINDQTGVTIKFAADEKGNLLQWEPTEASKDFVSIKEKICEMLPRYNLEGIPASKAIHIAAAAGKELQQKPKEREVGSAELVHYFDSIPSPIDLNKRAGLFVRMWELPCSSQEAQKIISTAHLNMPAEVELYWDSRFGSKTNQTYLLSSLIMKCPVEQTTTEFLDQSAAMRDECLEIIAGFILDKWKDAKLATGHFWKYEVGMLFSI